MAPSRAAVVRSTASPWLLGRWSDLILCCGGLAWIFVLLDQQLLRPHLPQLLGWVTIVMSVLGLLVGSSHTAATWVRIYDTAESRERFAFYTRWLPIALLGLGAVELAYRETIPVVLKITLFWNLHHYTAQSYGFVLLYCLKRDYRLAATEKRILWLMMSLSTLTIALIQLTYREYNLDVLMGQKMPFWEIFPPWVSQTSMALLGASVIAFTGIVLWKAYRDRQWLPLPAAVLLVTNLVLMVAPIDLWNLMWAYTPALFHGCQYIVITLLYLTGAQPGLRLRDRLMSNGTPSRYLLMVALGAFFYNAVPQTFQQAGVDFNLSFAVIYTLISLHHYATDGAIWKLRDDRLRAVLLGTGSARDAA